MTKEQSTLEIKRLHDDFIHSVTRDIEAKRYPQDPDAYRKFYLDQLIKSDPALHGHLRNVQYRKRETRLLGQVDHKIPRSVWIPLTGLAQQYESVLSNLWIRDAHSNSSYDHHMINLIKKQEARNQLDAAKKLEYIGFFLALKDRDIEGYPWVAKSFGRLSRWEAEQMIGDIDGKPIT